MLRLEQESSGHVEKRQFKLEKFIIKRVHRNMTVTIEPQLILLRSQQP